LFDLFLSIRNDSIEFCARHEFDVHTHGPTTSPVVALLLGDAETEIVLVSFVGRDAHLENAEAFRTLRRDFEVVVGVLDAFEALFLAEFEFVCNRALEVDWEGVLETELELAVRLDDGRFGRLDQVALLRNVLIRNVVAACLADSANFAHVGVGDKVDIAANRRKVGRNFEFFTVLGGGRTCATYQERYCKETR